MESNLSNYDTPALIAELVKRFDGENSSVVLLTAVGDKEEIHVSSSLSVSCRLLALFFSSVVKLFSQNFNISRDQGRALAYESLDVLLSERLPCFFDTKGVSPGARQDDFIL